MLRLRTRLTATTDVADTVNIETRYSFVGQHLEASAIFVRRLQEMEALPLPIDEVTRCEHRGLVCAVILQCATALEAEAHEVCTHGPASHLGSNGTDHHSKAFLLPLADVIGRQSTLDRFELILHVLRKPAFDRGKEPFQSAALVVRLRNELTHYKSRWGDDMASDRLFAALKSLRHQPPPFTAPSMNFFPHLCLSAACAAWALHSIVDFLDRFYQFLGVPSRFETYRARLLP